MPVERVAITDREQWLALRQQDVTASVAGALLGVHPYTSAFGLFLLKAGLATEDPEETGPMRRGRLLEPVAAQILREEYPKWEIRHPAGFYYRDPETRIGATPDVFAFNERGEPGVVQVKSVEPGVFRREWMTPEGTVEPPLWIVVQALIEAHLTGSVWAAVAPMVVSFGLEMPVVPIPIHAGVMDRIKIEVCNFWQRIKEGRNYDPNYAKDGALIARLYPQDSGLEVDLRGDNEVPLFVDQLEAARAKKKAAEADEKIAKAAITSKMGDAAIALLATGRRVSNKTTNRDGYSVGPSSFRVIRLVKGGR